MAPDLIEVRSLDAHLAFARELCNQGTAPRRAPLEFAFYADHEAAILRLRDALGETYPLRVQHYPRVGAVAAAWVLEGCTSQMQLDAATLTAWVERMDSVARACECALDGFAPLERG